MKKVLHFFLFLVFSLLFAFQLNTSCSPSTTKNDDAGIKEAPPQVEVECTVASQCQCSEICTEGSCQEIKCQSTEDCRCGWKCVAGRCYEPSKAPCESDKDCTDKKLWKCDAGKCVDGGCRRDSDCADTPETPICNVQKHVCEKKKCTSNADCFDPSKPICEPKTGDCQPDNGASLGEDCTSKPCKLNLVCHQEEGKKVCRKPCIPFDTRVLCESPLECFESADSPRGGVCLEPGKGLKEGEDCSGGKKCQRHLVCAFFGGKETCRRRCKTSDNCFGLKEECRDYMKMKLCLPPAAPCGPGRACDGEAEGWERCENNQCKLLLCPTQRACPLTHKCTPTGRCIPKHCPEEACPLFHVCQNHRCVRTNEGFRCGPGQKVPTDQCGKDLICTSVGYLNACARSCESKTCPKGFECKRNQDGKRICLQPCSNGAKCKFEDYFCYEMKSSISGRFCVPVGQPTGKEMMKACDNTDRCMPYLTCKMGYFGKKGFCTRSCTSNADCGNLPNVVCADYLGSKNCYLKCSRQSYGSCTIDSKVSGYCSRSRNGIYICRPR